MYNEKYFSDDQFSYIVPCLNLEGIKYVIFYKFRRSIIDQNCSAVCTNNGSHRDALLNERTFREAKRETRSVLCRNLVVDSTERECHH